MDISRLSQFCYRQFREGIYDDMIFISPEVRDLLLIFIGEGNIDTQAGIWVAFRDFGFQKSVFDNSFKVIFFDIGSNWA